MSRIRIDIHSQSRRGDDCVNYFSGDSMKQAKAILSGMTLAVALASGARAETDPAAVLETYADIAHATYQDALTTAQDLQSAVAALVADPSDETLRAAKQAWLRARDPYQQTEAYRFGNPLVDDWEGKVNAWPLDEGLIDYVDPGLYGSESDENRFYAANVIVSPTIEVAGRSLDATTIDAALIQDLHEIDDVEANVAVGYHAIEFLLWGQDLNGTGPGAGARPATDYSLDQCTHGNCDRRAAYLTAATDLLVSDVADMVALWDEGGEARQAVIDAGPSNGLRAIITGLGSLSYGELAGERIQLGLMLHDPEEEHDCFSDNTHNSHYFDQRGMANVYHGRYLRIDGSVVEGPSLADLVAETSPVAAEQLSAAMEQTLARMQVMVDTAEAGMAYDQMLAAGNDEGNKIIQDVVDALKVQTAMIEQAASALQLDVIAFEGSDSLDDPNAVFQ